MKDHIAVIGAGAWGTALAIQADRAGQSVMLWARDSARAALMAQSRANERLLPGVPLPPGITVTANATQALQDAALILLVVPAQALRPVLQSLPTLSAPVLICAKGVEAGSLMLPLEVLAEMEQQILVEAAAAVAAVALTAAAEVQVS
jgi:glycerol-3-phosphate dehydrogenase (NAD(P)+)